MEDQSIDLMMYAKKIWFNRFLLLKVLGIAIVVGIIIALSTPKEYTAISILAPESGKTSSGLSSVSSMLGLGNINIGGEGDAINVSLYPNIITSTPFILDLIETKVQTLENNSNNIPLIYYLNNYNSDNFIHKIIKLPSKLFSSCISLFITKNDSTINNYKNINAFHLTKDQARIVHSIRQRINADIDKKSGITTISVTMQDPLVAAILTDTVIVKLQKYITKYRTSKALEDCKYWEELNEQRKQEYYEVQKKYANYVDANKNVVLQSVRIEQERLQNEMNLAYQVYSNVATQLQMAKAKVQEAKPVFAVVEPATVPIIPSGTSRKMILLGIVFLAVAGAAAWVLFGQDLLKMVKEGLGKQPAEEKKDA